MRIRLQRFTGLKRRLRVGLAPIIMLANAGCVSTEAPKICPVVHVCEGTQPESLAQQQISPLGFSATQIIEMLGTSRKADIRWLDNPGIDFGQDESGPSGGLTLRVEVPQDSDARYFASELNTSAGSDCGSWLEIDAQVSLTTDDGVVDETLPMILRAKGEDYVEASIQLDSHELRSPPSVDLGNDTPDIQLCESPFVAKLNWTPHSVSGIIAIGTEQIGPNGEVITGFDRVAEWPLDRSCQDGTHWPDSDLVPVPNEEHFGPVVPLELRQLVLNADSINIEWSDELVSPLQTRIDFTDTSSCASPKNLFGTANEAPTLWARADVGWTASDGSVEGNWPGTIEAFVDAAGAFSYVLVGFEWAGDGESLADDHGLTQVELTKDDEVTFSSRVTYFSDGSVSGEYSIEFAGGRASVVGSVYQPPDPELSSSVTPRSDI